MFSSVINFINNMGNTSNPNPDPTQQLTDNVTTSASNMEKILSDEQTTPKENINNAQYNQYLQQQQYQQQQRQQHPQQFVQHQQHQQHPQHQQQQPQYVYGYQQQPSINTAQFNPSPQQLQMQLEQQMQQLHLLQQAQQLERQRLDLARQQRHLEAKQATMDANATANATANANNNNNAPLQEQTQTNTTVNTPKKEETKVTKVSNVTNVTNVMSEIPEIDEKYPSFFRWSHGGRDVYVAYSGDNWSQKYRMHRSHNDFSLIMEIPPGVYHYKFIVDNQWRCAPDQKHVRDSNGAYSNVLDVRSHSYQQVIDEQKRKRKREKQKAQYQYTQNLPKSDHYVQDPPICPIHLHKVILNENNRKKSQKKKNKNKLNQMHLPKPLRVSLNHLYVSDKREEEVVTLGMTERYKDKFFTIVYYTPIESFQVLSDCDFQVSNNYY